MKSDTIKEIEKNLGVDLDTIPRRISVFDKKTGEWIKDIKLKPIPLAVLQKLYDQPEDEPFIEIFEVTNRHALALQKYIADRYKEINIEKYYYHLEPYPIE